MIKYNQYNNKVRARPAGNEPKAFKGIKAEQIDELGGRYSITINPEDPRGQDKYNFVSEAQTPEDELKEIYNSHIESIFKKLKYCEIIVNPELSPTGRLHYHGVLTVIDTVLFLWHDVQIIRQQAQCEIDTIQDTKVWEEYISKQNHLLSKKGITTIHTKNRKEESKK